jgi:RNA polymerase sigma-70 factor (ECF subfamily)
MWVKRKFRVLAEDEFADVYRAYWQKLYSIAYNYVRDKATAQELVQDVFVKLWLKRNEVTEIENAEAYLFKCLKNKVYDHFDRVACQKKLSKYKLENLKEEHYPVDETVAFNEAMSVISDELEKMPVKTRTIFRMSKFDSYTNDEIANEMHLSGKAVEYHITQALKKLRVRLAVFLS